MDSAGCSARIKAACSLSISIYYLDEFPFHFNRRRSKARGLLFHRLAEQAVAVDPAPYPTIIAKPSKPSASKRSGQ